MCVIVQLIKVGSEVKSFDVSDNPILQNLLNQAGEQFVPNTITINSNNVITPNTRLNDGDRVFIGNKLKGNAPYVVEFIRLGQGEVISVSVEEGTTIARCFEMMSSQNRGYFINSDGKEVFQYQINGIPKQSTDIIPPPDSEGGTVRVICAMKIKGN